MKSLNIIQTTFKVAKILSEIAFVFAIVGFCAASAGLLSFCLGGDGAFKIGGVTFYGIISENANVNADGVIASLSAVPFACVGIAVTAKFTELYFKNEQKAGTPFTFEGAKELLRVGIISIVLPVACGIAGSIVESIVAESLNVEKVKFFNELFNNEVNVVFGVMLIAVSFLCRYGAELNEGKLSK